MKHLICNVTKKMIMLKLKNKVLNRDKKIANKKYKKIFEFFRFESSISFKFFSINKLNFIIKVRVDSYFLNYFFLLKCK